jgi:methyl-accepting chemotaxis protein
MITAADARPGAVVEDEVRRLSNRLREAETERAKLIESFSRLSASAREDSARLETRMQRLEKESDERFEKLVGQRTAMRVLRERVQGLLKLAEDIAQSDVQGRKPLLETARKLAELPPDAE